MYRIGKATYIQYTGHITRNCEVMAVIHSPAACFYVLRTSDLIPLFYFFMKMFGELECFFSGSFFGKGTESKEKCTCNCVPVSVLENKSSSPHSLQTDCPTYKKLPNWVSIPGSCLDSTKVQTAFCSMSLMENKT